MPNDFVEDMDAVNKGGSRKKRVHQEKGRVEGGIGWERMYGRLSEERGRGEKLELLARPGLTF